MKRMLAVASVGLACCFALLAFSARGAGESPRSKTPVESKVPAKAVSFSKDVAPIFYKNCVVCHRPNELAPMSLLTFKEARPWAASIREKVVTRQMPPWHADPAFGTFSNSLRLSQEEVDTVVAWVDQGAKEGNPKDLPAAPRFSADWNIGKPDVILSLPQEYTLSAEGPDEYINFVLPTKFNEDVWVQAAEVRPGNRRIVHHAIVFIQPKQNVAQGPIVVTPTPPPSSIFYKDGTVIRTRMDALVYDDGCGAPNGGFASGSGVEVLGFPLCFYTLGKAADTWPAGIGKRIPAGSNIVIQMHYSRSGKVEKDLTSIGLKITRQPPEKELTAFAALNHYFKIPAGADAHEVKACYRFSRDVELFTYLPHMHLRGKDMKYEVVYPDGKSETLLYVPNYNFNWQTMYVLERPIVIPKGSKLIITAHFDNSSKNRYNPDPTKTIRFGEPTYDEMMVGYFDMYNRRSRPATRFDPSVYEAYAGEYTIGPGAPLIVVSKEGSKLMFTALGQPKIEALQESETKFFFQVIDAQVTFEKNEKSEVTGLLFEINGQKIRAKKVEKAAPAGSGK